MILLIVKKEITKPKNKQMTQVDQKILKSTIQIINNQKILSVKLNKLNNKNHLLKKKSKKHKYNKQWKQNK